MPPVDNVRRGHPGGPGRTDAGGENGQNGRERLDVDELRIN